MGGKRPFCLCVGGDNSNLVMLISHPWLFLISFQDSNISNLKD